MLRIKMLILFSPYDTCAIQLVISQFFLAVLKEINCHNQGLMLPTKLEKTLLPEEFGF